MEAWEAEHALADGGGSGSSNKKHQVPKTVCIVTEFLEQGSLADILYGPRRLPAGTLWSKFEFHMIAISLY